MSMARGSELACIFAVNYSDLEGVLTQYMVKSDLFLVECCRDIFKDRQEPVVCAVSVTDLSLQPIQHLLGRPRPHP